MDISANNIITTDPKKADGFKGTLIDLDLAEEVGSSPSRLQTRTGTLQFMAIEVLEGKVSHTYRHDLESFLYVLIWLCARRGWVISGNANERPEIDLLSMWYAGPFEDIARRKCDSMGKRVFEIITHKFPSEFDCVKPLCRRLRGILFSDEGGGLFMGTPEDSEELYAPLIGGLR